MKIRTITCHHSFNHGAMLQAFALVKYLQTLGHDVAVIDYRPKYQPGHKVDPSFTPGIGFLGTFGLRHLYGLYKRIQAPRRKAYYELEQSRRDTFESFFKKYIQVTQTQYTSIKQLRNNPPEADMYIAGSDQIWNTKIKNGRDSAFYLDFGHPKRKISYAASFATTTLNGRFKAFVRSKLRNFDAIGVREKSGLLILESLGFDGLIVVDPVFLLARHVWDVILGPHEGVFNEDADDYILTYDFEARGGIIEPVAKRLSTLFKCKIYSVSPYNLSYADRSFVCCCPFSFVSLIKHARCVVSNSFHATAFSLIYAKDFFVVNRKDGLNVRMQDLLSHYGLSNRLINGSENDEFLVEHIDYNSVDKILAEDIIESKSFLQNQIEFAKKQS